MDKKEEAVHAEYIFHVSKDDNFVEDKKKRRISYY